MILKIHHAQITIPNGAEDKAREFYCRVLGLEELPKPEQLAGRGGLWLRVGDRQLHIGTEDNAGRESTKAHVAYQVADLDAWRSLLGEHRVEIKDGIQIPRVRRFEFRDPFGNRIEFLEEGASVRA
jgi:catechol 2,3-dioxygenase-like lactoylglutathione lyase family enzyme